MVLNYITFPAITPSKVTWDLVGLSTLFTSPGGQTQGIERTSLWQASMTFSDLSEDNIRDLQAYCDQMKRPSNVSQITDPAYNMRGSGAGSPLVNGAGQTGFTLNTKGWTASQTNILRNGDLIELDTKQMVRVIGDVNSDASGLATLTVEPAIRTAPTNSAAITISSPSAVMRFATFTAPISVSPPIVGDLSISMLEVLI